MARMPGVPFVRPRSYSLGRPAGPPRWVILHYTAGHEGPDDAENGAAYDQRRTDGVSSHFYVDSNSIVQCVDTNDRSHTALYHGNMWGIHIEIAGTRQTREQWLDAVSRPTIRFAAKVTAWALREHDLPFKRLAVNALADPAARGIADHNACTVSFPDDGGTHTDVGPGFPWDIFLQDVADFMNGDDMTPEEFLNTVVPSATLGDQTVAQLLKDARSAKIVGDKILAGQVLLMQEVDGAEEALAGLTTLVGSIQAGDPQAVATALLAVLPGPVAKATADELHARTAS